MPSPRIGVSFSIAISDVDLAERVADAQRPHHLRGALHELVVRGALDEEPLGRRANLAGVEERGEHPAARGHVQLRVSENDEWIRAAEFEQQLLDPRSRAGHDPRQVPVVRIGLSEPALVAPGISPVHSAGAIAR